MATLTKTLLVIVFVAIFTAGKVRGSGDLHRLLGAAFGNRLQAVLSSCCVVREFKCPVPSSRIQTSYHRNSSSDISYSLQRFGQCICSRRRHCFLSFPSSFLPDGAHGVTYDVTFVTVRTTSKFKCTYHGSRTLICERGQSLSTAVVGLTVPGTGLGVTLASHPEGLAALMASAGLLGEAMEEAMEHIVESGAFPTVPRPPPANKGCRRCVPLLCAITVAEELEKLKAFRHVPEAGSGGRSDQQRYHRCLTQNSIRPPQQNESSTTTTTTSPSHALLPTPPPSTTTTTTTVTTTTTTTTKISATTPASTTKRASPSAVTTSEFTGSPAASKNKNQTTTVVVPKSSAIPPVVGLAGGSSTLSAKASSTSSEVITRFLVGWTTTPAKEYRSGEDEDEVEGDTAEGGGMDVGVVAIGVASPVLVLAACLLFLFLRRRRRRYKRKEGLDSSTAPAVAKHTAAKPVGEHYKARPLPSISGKKTGLKSWGEPPNDTVVHSTRDQKAMSAAQRYITPEFMAASSKLSLNSKSSTTADGESLYASLDETTMIPTNQPPPVFTNNVHTSGNSYTASGSLAINDKVQTSKESSSKKLKTDALTSSHSSKQGIRGSSGYYNLKSDSGAPAPQSSGSAKRPISCAGNRASYVNISSSDANNTYEQPSFQEDHEYKALSCGVGDDLAVTETDSCENERSAYLHPCGTPKLSRSGKSHKEHGSSNNTNNSRHTGNQSNEIDSTNTCHNVSGVGSSNNSYKSQKDSQQKLISEKETAQTSAARGRKDPSGLGATKIPVGYSVQGSDWTSSSGSVDQDGYLVPVTPSK